MLISTAIVMQTLAERGGMTSERGKRIIAVLLFEDLLIVPLLALVAFLSPQIKQSDLPGWQQFGVAVGAVAVLVAAGIWLLNHLVSPYRQNQNP
ncbi:cation:proton antiporter domain-containing protein [Neisseria yangbaofengii]|uniref:cation:proton antiporter domain-containing protein n=1 Tax=Neisseria yangbaofengii TaxID=2709396 RepID=UPI00197CFA63|nr:cation:proton antiporter [Neisseria yangbaofengii]